MLDSDSQDVVRRAEQLYYDRLKQELEPAHLDEFVAIEPDSGDFYLGRTLSEAAGLARRAHPNRTYHLMRVGHKAAIHMGAAQS